MRHLKILLITVILITLTPITNIFADWNGIVLIDEYSDNGSHFYWADDFNLPYSENYIINEQELILNEYVEDFSGNLWDLYSYSIELIGDGTSNTYDSYIANIKNIDNGYQVIENLGSDVMLNTIGDKEYLLHQDRTVILYGDKISLKRVGETSYSKGEADNYLFMIDYIQNRYSNESDKELALSSNDFDNEEIMRAGELSISILVPSGENIKEYYFNGSSDEFDTVGPNKSDESSIDDLITNNISDSLGNDYYIEKEQDNIVIKNDLNEEAIIIKKEDNKFSILVKDENLLADEDYLNDVITETIYSIFAIDDNTTVTKTKYGYDIVNKNTGEVIKVNNSKGISNTVITIDSAQTNETEDISKINVIQICTLVIFMCVVCLIYKKIKK